MSSFPCWAVWVGLNLKKCSLWDVGTRLHTNWIDRSSISLPLIYLLAHSAASRFRRRSDEQGSEVRGRGRGARCGGGKGRGGAHCLLTHMECCSDRRAAASFPLASVALADWAGRREERTDELFTEGRRGKEATRWIGGFSPLTHGLAEGGECAC